MTGTHAAPVLLHFCGVREIQQSDERRPDDLVWTFETDRYSLPEGERFRLRIGEELMNLTSADDRAAYLAEASTPMFDAFLHEARERYGASKRDTRLFLVATDQLPAHLASLRSQILKGGAPESLAAISAEERAFLWVPLHPGRSSPTEGLAHWQKDTTCVAELLVERLAVNDPALAERTIVDVPHGIDPTDEAGLLQYVAESFMTSKEWTSLFASGCGSVERPVVMCWGPGTPQLSMAFLLQLQRVYPNLRVLRVREQPGSLGSLVQESPIPRTITRHAILSAAAQAVFDWNFGGAATSMVAKESPVAHGAGATALALRRRDPGAARTHLTGVASVGPDAEAAARLCDSLHSGSPARVAAAEVSALVWNAWLHAEEADEVSALLSLYAALDQTAWVHWHASREGLGRQSHEVDVSSVELLQFGKPYSTLDRELQGLVARCCWGGVGVGHLCPKPAAHDRCPFMARVDGHEEPLAQFLRRETGLDARGAPRPELSVFRHLFYVTKDGDLWKLRHKAAHSFAGSATVLAEVRTFAERMLIDRGCWLKRQGPSLGLEPGLLSGVTEAFDRAERMAGGGRRCNVVELVAPVFGLLLLPERLSPNPYPGLRAAIIAEVGRG